MSEEDTQHPQHPREDDRNDEVEDSPVPDPESGTTTEEEDTGAV